jgi:RimJ/RimL family protein N-acetyltransferase
MKLETERLLIKKYTPKEKADLIALFTDEKVMRHVNTGVMSVGNVEKLWKKLMEDFYPNGKDTIFAVFAKDDKRYIGHAAIRPRPTKTTDWEISYMLKTEEWGKGFATEIAQRLIKFGFDDLNLPLIVATIDDDNLDSIKVAEKAGMSFSHYEFDAEGRFSVYSITPLKVALP